MSKALVAYFSATGSTKRIAEMVASAAGAELYAITPQVPYTRADLDWMDKNSRTTIEMNNKSSRPALTDTNAPVSDADVIFIGFPVWWYTAPTIINSFLESYDFTGKKIVLFATSGGSGISGTAKALQPSAPGAQIVEGKLMNRASAASIAAWVQNI